MVEREVEIRHRGLCLACWLSVSAFLLSPPFASSQGPAPAGQNAPTAGTTIDPKAQELLDRAIQALGGAAFLGFMRLSSSGRIFAIADGITAGFAPFESLVEFPDKRRFSYGKKQPVIMINDGDHAWELDKYGLTSQLPEQVHRWKLATRYGLENLLRRRIREPGILIQDGGVDFVDNVPTRVVDIIEKEEVEVKLFLNRQNFLPVRISYRVRHPQTGEWDSYADVYGDYQKIQEIQTPMHIARFLNDERIGEIFRNNARYDENFPPGTFEPAR